MKRKLPQWLGTAGLLALLALCVAGCKSNDADNVSSMPWNSTEGWQSGFPSALNEGR